MSKKDRSASRACAAGASPPNPPFKAQHPKRPGRSFLASSPDTSYIAATVPKVTGGETAGG